MADEAELVDLSGCCLTASSAAEAAYLWSCREDTPRTVILDVSYNSGSLTLCAALGLADVMLRKLDAANQLSVLSSQCPPRPPRGLVLRLDYTDFAMVFPRHVPFPQGEHELAAYADVLGAPTPAETDALQLTRDLLDAAADEDAQCVCSCASGWEVQLGRFLHAVRSEGLPLVKLEAHHCFVAPESRCTTLLEALVTAPALIDGRDDASRGYSDGLLCARLDEFAITFLPNPFGRADAGVYDLCCRAAYHRIASAAKEGGVATSFSAPAPRACDGALSTYNDETEAPLTAVSAQMHDDAAASDASSSDGVESDASAEQEDDVRLAAPAISMAPQAVPEDNSAAAAVSATRQRIIRVFAPAIASRWPTPPPCPVPKPVPLDNNDGALKPKKRKLKKKKSKKMSPAAEPHSHANAGDGTRSAVPNAATVLRAAPVNRPVPAPAKKVGVVSLLHRSAPTIAAVLTQRSTMRTTH
jgi:hypothetical protein